jgi:hypothetical protein
MGKMKDRPYLFILIWILINMIGVGICSILGNILLGGEFMFGSSTNDPVRFAIAAVFGAFSGGAVGIFQSVVLWKIVKPTRLPFWALANLLGSIAGFLVITSLYSATASYQHEIIRFFAAAMASGCVSGLIIGIVQWILLRDVYPKAKWWIAANIGAGIIAYGVRWAWITRLDESLGDCSFSLAFGVLLGDALLALLASCLFGLVTGFSLLRITDLPIVGEFGKQVSNKN